MKSFNTKIISTNKYYINKFITYIYFVLVLILFYLLFGGSSINSEGYFARKGAPVWNYVVGGVAFVVFLLLYFINLARSGYKKGDIMMNENVIEIKPKGKIYKISSIENLKVQFDPTKYKLIDNRELLKGAGNNWILFNYYGKRVKFEFLLDSKVKEDELFGLLQVLSSKGINVKIEKAKETFWSEFR